MSSDALAPQDEQHNGKQNGKPTPGEANLNPPTVTSKLNGKESPSQGGRTFALQHKLPKLPVPPLKDTCDRYLRALKGLQDDEEHAATQQAVAEFLKSGGEGERLQKKLMDYNEGVDSYVEEFWYESYLQFQESVVLSLNPFFVLSSDVTPSNSNQLPRAASLILGSLYFVHDLRNELLEPDTVRGVPLDMSQYRRLFGTSRVPTQSGCRIDITEDSKHIVVLRRGQMYWFDCLDAQNRPLLNAKEILKNLEAIVEDGDQTPAHEVAQNAVGLLTTENRKIWSDLRKKILNSNKNNAECLSVVDTALFIVCLDDCKSSDLSQLCGNFLCGTYDLQQGVQVGTCTNRWYDKLQIIVDADGEAGINFEHTGVDGHTVLRYAADVYTELVLLFAKSINPATPSFFKAKLSPYSKSYKAKPGETVPEATEEWETMPRRLQWKLTPEIRAGIRFAETRISDLICQNDSQALEFKGYGKNFITRHGFSPDAFVQMAFQAAYYGLYGRVESTYEPAMTKAFLHGRTEAIRTVQPESVQFVKTFCDEGSSIQEKIEALKNACKRHTALTKECSQGLGQDRHLYAMYCLAQREIERTHANRKTMPDIFSDPGYTTLSTSVLSTSNCGNPALRLFGFGPVTPEGQGIGYIIKDDGISVCASSKHLQTRRFLDNLQSYLYEIQRMLIQAWRQANDRSESFVDHSGTVRDVRTGKAIEVVLSDDGEDKEDALVAGFGFYDAGVDMFQAQRTRKHVVGKTLRTSAL
ncbi:hypothetical protein NliqN6_1139 [Naganishia liquefaciens]|uniref:Choline/carnitine acyltransferase domain-containing protein n=1 Tax=Naganishia liquefaciens TaxID=104408 RepID=A0A8H3TP99_9TREE|nr:hypothetical protein NliqN6_1139 [Naganishia liquefaciens]